MEQYFSEEDGKRNAPFKDPDLPGMLDILSEGIFSVDRDFRLTYVNACGARLFGSRPGELEGRIIWEAVPGSWCPSLAARLRKALQKGSKVSFEVYCPEPARIWLHCQCMPVDGGAAVSMQDITQWKTREEQTSESQRRMQLEMDELNVIYRSAPIGLCVLDRDMRYVKINDFLARINGRSASEHIGRTPWEMAPAFTHEMEEVIRAVIATGEPRLSMELMGDPVPGNRRPRSFMTHWLPLRDDRGSVMGVNVVVEDTTARTQADRSMKVSETNYRAIFDSANDAIFIHDASDGAILDANREAAEMYGYTAEEMRGLQVGDISSGEPPYDMEEARRKIRLLLDGGRQPLFSWRARDKWGQLFWVEVSLKMTAINGEQRVIALIRDITRRRHLEEALRQSREDLEVTVRERTRQLDLSNRMLEEQKEILQKIIDSIPVMIIFYGASGVPRMVNREFTRLMGWSLDDILGMDILEENFPDPVEREEVRGFIMRAEPGWRDLEPRVRGGKALPSSWANIRLSDGSLIGIGIDIRSRRQMAQSQKLEAIGTLAGGIAHDLKNIFTPIMINIELALEDVGGACPAQPVLEEALQAARMGADLTRQIVTFSRRNHQEFSPVKVSQVMRETLAFLKSTLPANVELSLTIGDEDAVVIADPTQLKQVLLNLGSNAGHAMREKGGILGVDLDCVSLDAQAAGAVSPRLAPGCYACIAFKDSGTGMDEKTLEHIFEPFYTTKAKGEGSGMGLAVVHGIVHDHKGAITVRSSPGSGTTFRVYLPMASDDQAPRHA